MKKLISRLYYYIGKLKLRNKLLFSYLIFLFIPMCFFTTITFQRFSVILKNDIMTSIEHNYGQTYSYLSDKTEKIENTSNIIFSSADVNNVFSIQINEEWQAKNYYLIKQSVNSLSSLEDKDIDRVILFLFQSNAKPELSYSFRSMSNVSNSKWYN